MTVLDKPARRAIHDRATSRPEPGGITGVAARLRAKFPLRTVPTTWSATRLEKQTLLDWLVPPPFGSDNAAVQWKRRNGLSGLLRWLRAQEGDNRQQRWLASGVEDHDGKHWREHAVGWPRDRGEDTNAADLSTGLLALLCGGVIRPGVRWMMTRQSPRFRAVMERSCDRDGFARPRFVTTRGAMTVKPTVMAPLADNDHPPLRPTVAELGSPIRE